MNTIGPRTGIVICAWCPTTVVLGFFESTSDCYEVSHGICRHCDVELDAYVEEYCNDDYDPRHEIERGTPEVR